MKARETTSIAYQERRSTGSKTVVVTLIKPWVGLFNLCRYQRPKDSYESRKRIHSALARLICSLR